MHAAVSIAEGHNAAMLRLLCSVLGSGSFGTTYPCKAILNKGLSMDPAKVLAWVQQESQQGSQHGSQHRSQQGSSMGLSMGPAEVSAWVSAGVQQSVNRGLSRGLGRVLAWV